MAGLLGNQRDLGGLAVAIHAVHGGFGGVDIGGLGAFDSLHSVLDFLNGQLFATHLKIRTAFFGVAIGNTSFLPRI